MGKLARRFVNGTLNEKTIENESETNFVVNFDNGRTLWFIENNYLKFADVVSSGEPMAMMV